MIRCTVCRSEFTDAELEADTKAIGCPKCGTQSVPCDTKNDVTINVNWHELRILGIWAENWANHLKETGELTTGVTTVNAIAQAIQAQHPDRIPITLSGEIRRYNKTYQIDTNIDLTPNLICIKGEKE